MVGRFESTELKRDALAHEEGTLFFIGKSPKMADWTEHRRRLQSGSSAQVQEAAGALLKSTRAQRAELLSSAPEPWGQVLLAASGRLGEDRTPLFAWLAALTDLRPPPVPELARHFGDPVLQDQLVAAAAHPSPGLRLAVFRCLRNLARAEPLRRGLLGAIPSLVRALSASEISGAAAAALCNLACGQEGKIAAFGADAVPALLRALPSAPSADDADDLAAAIGVLSTGGLPEGCAWPDDLQVAPLVAAFDWGSPVLTSTLLNVLVDLTIALGPSGAARHQLGKDERLAASRLPEYLQSAAPEIRGLALKLCVLLQDVPSFQSAFRMGQGGDSSAVQEQLRDVQQIQASQQAFAAILADGSVVTWGHADYGGDSSSVQNQLRDVQHIQASSCAFAAVLGDGSVVTWGHADFGGDSRDAQHQLRDVQHIQASHFAFAAIRSDGSVVTWGSVNRGGDSSVVQDQLRDVQQIQASLFAFAAILGDGSVVTWGDAGKGGDSSAVQEQLRDVQQIQASQQAFAAILADGSVVTWGHADYGGDSSSVQNQLRDVQHIQASYSAFAAILGDGSVVTWGKADFGGDSSAVREQLRDVQQIQACIHAFAAIRSDGSVVTWGRTDYGGDSSAVQDQLRDVQQIQASNCAFAAILGDGSVVSWGDAAYGSDSSGVQHQLRDAQHIQASVGAFAAILGDGTDALRSVVAAEPPPPTMPMINVQAKRAPTQWMRGYANSWQLRCNMPSCEGHNSWTTGGAMAVCTPVAQQPTAPPSRREIAEQLLATLATGQEALNLKALFGIVSSVHLDAMIAIFLHRSAAVVRNQFLVRETQETVQDALRIELQLDLECAEAIGLLGMVSPLVSIEAFHLPLLFSRAALPPAPSVSESTGYVDYGLVPPPPAPEVGQMHVDLSLVAVLVTILAICVEADASVESLKHRAQTALAVPSRGRLLNSSGEVLDGVQTVTEAELRSGDVLTLHVNQVQIKARKCVHCRAFAAILGDGSVVTWGDVDFAGDSSAIQEQLRDVQQIQASIQAFAAILGDGSVVTWGDARSGGDSSAVQEQLRDVQQIQASAAAFAAIRGDGSVVTWGDVDFGGDSIAIQEQLRDVQQIQASHGAFAAIRGDGSVVTWGDATRGGNSSAVQCQLRDVQEIQASYHAFAAILGDGSVVTWGDADCGGDSSAVQEQLRDVQQIQVSAAAFAAIRGDGSVVTWGDVDFGGDSSAIQEQLRDVQQVQASQFSFAAIRSDGSVVTWGPADYGGDSRAVQEQLRDV
ncbi:putative E3 ubiquitin-protein ligase HERC1 [Symbiodinium microadriaticum]|uniref:Putative E3 ubiquitin-protein ligase HERC1 n=1 Tax=Symbiodinium microadriaticum TaxID=2951 RepID=A0A1Q9D9Z0_SYMMI|nr:putative E3 ubiquitin-protein ligase HERC1 [Symbiodinium microadriaticum]